MSLMLKSIALAVVGAGVELASLSPAQALEVSQCFAKSDQVKVLSDAGQNRVVGAIQNSLVKSEAGKEAFAEIKITFTSNREQSQGFILIEGACALPSGATAKEESNPSVYVAASVRVQGVFNNTLEYIPARARSNKPREDSDMACKEIMNNRARSPHYLELAAPNYIHDLNEAISKKVGSPIECDPLDYDLSNLRANNYGVMYQGVVISDNGQPGLQIIIAGKPNMLEGFGFLVDTNGAAFPAGLYEKVLYLDDAPTFVKIEEPYTPSRAERDEQQLRNQLAKKWGDSKTIFGGYTTSNFEKLETDLYAVEHFDALYDKSANEGEVRPDRKENTREAAFGEALIERRLALGINFLRSDEQPR